MSSSDSAAAIFDVMTGRPTLAPFIAAKRHRIEAQDFDTEFSPRLLQKDLGPAQTITLA